MAIDQLDLATGRQRPFLGVPVVVRRIGLAVGTGVLSLVMVSACGASSGGSSSAAQAPAPSIVASAVSSAASGSDSTGTHATAMIMIEKFKYTTPITVSPGAMVSVMNMDGESHTVTADSGNAFDDKATAGTTTTFKAPMTAGSYPYHCSYHSNMHGVLIVK
jgi:plastocyanin